MKKAYITDLDHTFLRNDLTLSSFTKEIWNEMAKNSIATVATARTYKKTAQFLSGIDINTPMILLDGALIATVDKKIIDTKFINKEIADTIIDEGGKFCIYPFVLALADKNLSESFLYSTILNELIECRDIRGMDNNFKIVYMGDENLLRKLALHLAGIFGDTLKYILAPEAYIGCYFLTILHKDADKSHGIKSINEYIDFELEELSVFGDNFNDIGMFEIAGKSIAVANAQEGVKKAADVVLKYTNNEDGVAKYLQGIKNG